MYTIGKTATTGVGIVWVMHDINYDQALALKY
jgi:hypothetical protein